MSRKVINEAMDKADVFPANEVNIVWDSDGRYDIYLTLRILNSATADYETRCVGIGGKMAGKNWHGADISQLFGDLMEKLGDECTNCLIDIEELGEARNALYRLLRFHERLLRDGTVTEGSLIRRFGE